MHAIAILSVRHTGDLRLNGSIYRCASHDDVSSRPILKTNFAVHTSGSLKEAPRWKAVIWPIRRKNSETVRDTV